MENIIFETKTKSGKTVSFRYPTIDDVQILTDYINTISSEKSFITFQGEQQTLEEETKWLKDKLEKIDKKECVYLLGFIDNKLVGCSEIEMKSLVKKHVGSFGISVAKEFRGNGAGEKLMEAVIKESIRKLPDLKIIQLDCFANNPVAQNLYKKLGFVEYGRLPNGLKRKGEFVDEILMYKKIK
jgi:RimJ/RimL family protein N-acetyltransferase